MHFYTVICLCNIMCHYRRRRGSLGYPGKTFERPCVTLYRKTTSNFIITLVPIKSGYAYGLFAGDHPSVQTWSCDSVRDWLGLCL